ncbi:MAG: hypothetical protein V4858_13275 [Pseudomonadota bacterium]
MYCSSSVSVHLLRGGAAIGSIFAAFYLSRYGIVWSAIAGIGAIALLRGCPMCWLMGLFETVRQKGRAEQKPGV